MSLIDSIRDCFCQNELPLDCAYRAVLFGESAGYFERVKSIVSYEKEEVVLSLKCGGLRVKGRDLYIKKYCEGDVVICGKILSVERIF